MVRIVERVEGYYDVQEVELGEVYRWNPGHLVVECKCGEHSSLTASGSVCNGCGADHASTTRQELDVRRLEDEALHPWHYAEDREHVGLPF